jgi:hypothetical protein
MVYADFAFCNQPDLGRIFLHKLSSHLESHLNCYFFWLLKSRLIEKHDILEKSCWHIIFIISDFNGGHSNEKKSSG